MSPHQTNIQSIYKILIKKTPKSGQGIHIRTNKRQIESKRQSLLRKRLQQFCFRACFHSCVFVLLTDVASTKHILLFFLLLISISIFHSQGSAILVTACSLKLIVLGTHYFTEVLPSIESTTTQRQGKLSHIPPSYISSTRATNNFPMFYLDAVHQSQIQEEI